MILVQYEREQPSPYSLQRQGSPKVHRYVDYTDAKRVIDRYYAKRDVPASPPFISPMYPTFSVGTIEDGMNGVNSHNGWFSTRFKGGDNV